MAKNIYEDTLTEALLQKDDAPKPYTPKQLLLAGALLLLGVFAVALSVVELKNRITVPLQNGDITPLKDELNNLQQPLTGDLDALKDTDGDGLSDKEELDIYGTSPYLTDTDSDGYNDKQEVDSGNDPNCPAGQNCFGGFLDNPDADTSTGEEDFTFPGIGTGEAGGQPQPGGIEADILSGIATPQQIRDLLLQSGADPALVEQMTDDEVLEIYQQTLTGLGTTEGGSAAANPLETLTGAQLRELLAQQGVGADILDQLTNEQLKQMFLDTVSS